MIDLAAEQLDVFDVTKGFKVMFTAPGDDYDVGKGIFCYMNLLIARV